MSHARYAPSGAHRWMKCAGSLRLCDRVGDRGSRYADEGTAAHEFAAWLLLNRPSEEEQEAAVDVMFTTINGVEYFLTKDMLGYIRSYAKLVDEYANGGELLVEERVQMSEAIGTADCYGTSDAIILHDDRIVIVDLKYGMGVKVSADYASSRPATILNEMGETVEVTETIRGPNPQMALYALGALETFDYLLGDIKTVVLVIHMPRLNHVSEFELSVADLHAFRAEARAARLRCEAAAKAPEEELEQHLEPGETQCRFCAAKATCPALRGVVDHSVDDDFRDLFTTAKVDADMLSSAMARVGMIEDWCKAVRAEVERRLLAGEPVKDWKLVQGRQGPRKWLSAKDAEALLKSFRCKQDEMYNFTLISPTDAEKLLANTSPKRWEKAQTLITRSDGKPSVAPATDPRPAMAVTAVSEDFADLVTTQEEN